MTDFSRTAEHLAIGRKSAADLLEHLARTEVPAHAAVRPHRLRTLLRRAA
jgi:hypothetical protein